MAPRWAPITTKQKNYRLESGIYGGDKSRFANAVKGSDAPIDICQIDTNDCANPAAGRLFATSWRQLPPSPLLFSRVQIRRVSSLIEKRVRTYLLLSPESFGITAGTRGSPLWTQNIGELGVTYPSLRFARLLALSFGLDLFAAAFFWAFWRSTSL
jgi:hypothetical protein